MQGHPPPDPLPGTGDHHDLAVDTLAFPHGGAAYDTRVRFLAGEYHPAMSVQGWSRGDGVGDAASVGMDVKIGSQMQDRRDELVESESEALEAAATPMTSEELAEFDAARAEAVRLAAEHGPDYHGFGHPPDDA
jgi:hypothetical protein